MNFVYYLDWLTKCHAGSMLFIASTVFDIEQVLFGMTFTQFEFRTIIIVFVLTLYIQYLSYKDQERGKNWRQEVECKL